MHEYEYEYEYTEAAKAVSNPAHKLSLPSNAPKQVEPKCAHKSLHVLEEFIPKEE